MQKLRWGIIGCGDVCERKSAPAMYKIEGSQLVAVMRRDIEKARDYAARHGAPKVYADASELIADPEVDIVYVATPPSTHKQYTLQALAAGKPVYVEKPMAMNHAECAEMVRAADAAGQKLFVAFYRRGLPYFLKVKQLLDSGAIGRVLAVDVKYMRPVKPSDIDPAQHTWRLDRAIAGEGYFYDLAPHTLDILDFLMGEIEWAAGSARNVAGHYEAADTVCAAMRFRSGALGTGLWNFASADVSREDSIVITGTDGHIAFNTFSFEPIHLVTASGTEAFAIDPPEHIQQPLIQTIVDEMRGLGQCPSTGVSASRTAWVMDMIVDSK